MFLSKVLSQFHNQNKTKQKKEKRKTKNAGKKPRGKYLLLCACLHIKVAGREFPAEMFPFSKKSKSRNLLLLKELCHKIKSVKIATSEYYMSETAQSKIR